MIIIAPNQHWIWISKKKSKSEYSNTDLIIFQNRVPHISKALYYFPQQDVNNIARHIAKKKVHK